MKRPKLPKLANVVGCQNWQVSSVAKIGKRCWLPKLANFEDTKVAKIGNFEETKVAKIGKYHQLPKLANVVGCQNWQILKTPKLPKLEFEHTCILIPCLLVLLHTLWCRLVCRNTVELNFVKTGLKFKFGVNPQSFSHELCLYITRFYSSRPFLCALVVCNQRTLNHISTSQLREPTIMLLFLLIHILGLYTFAQGQGERCFDLIDKRNLFFFWNQVVKPDSHTKAARV